MQMKELTDEKKCARCMYQQEIKFCVRKKAIVSDDEFCWHYVNRRERHSLEKTIRNLAKIFQKEMDRSEDDKS